MDALTARASTVVAVMDATAMVDVCQDRPDIITLHSSVEPQMAADCFAPTSGGVTLFTFGSESNYGQPATVLREMETFIVDPGAWQPGGLPRSIARGLEAANVAMDAYECEHTRERTNSAAARGSAVVAVMDATARSVGRMPAWTRQPRQRTPLMRRG